MGTTSVGQLLRSLCVDSQWEYAVFWKLKQRNRMFLTWEDGFCDHSQARSFVNCNLENFCFNETAGIASQYEINTYGGSYDGYPIGLAVANLSCLRYSLGEGFVGRVASSGKHCWVYSDDVYSALLHEYPDEWKLQFAVGIKTILLVPVFPLGVVQLGSLEKVTKDTKVVACIKDIFNTLQPVPEASMPLTLSRGLQGRSTSSLNSHLLETSTEQSMINLQNPIQSRLMVQNDLSSLDHIQILENRLSLTNPDIKSQLMGQGNIQIQKKRAERRTEVDALSPGSSEVSFPRSQFSNASHLEKLSNISNFSIHDEASASAQGSLSNLGFDFDPDTNMNLWFSNDIMDLPFGDEEEILASAKSNLTNLGFDFDTDMNMNLCFSNDMMDLPFGDEIFKETDHESAFGLLTFPADSELHKALGPAFQKSCNERVKEANFAGEDISSGSGFICHKDLTGGFVPSFRESSGFCKGISAKEDLWDAVVAGAYTAPGDTASNGFSDVRSPTTSSGQLTASCQTENKSQSDYMVGDDLGQWGNVKPAKLPFVSRHEVVKSSLSESSLKCTITTQVNEIQQKGCGYINSRMGTKISPVAKRKSRLGDVQKPRRPRDRQLIQDRLRELRELIPNGEKCSIDSLLDRTVKHMLFLRSVSNQAEKLKQHANRKAVCRKNLKSSETDDHQNGTSWKFELGHQLGVCPVIVEDLDHPGHMLIEVLCEEHELFLDIAQVLRNLELTILEGVTEQHSDKILAHFIVEVSSGFNKMNIFWPLMHLLQRSNPVPSII